MAKETARIEAFSDGVFAIAITLLVLELKVPHLGEETSGSALLHALLKQWPSYIGFLLSFLTILIMWINHHGLFNLVRKSDARFMFANGFLLLMVTATPFPTALMAEYLRTPAANIACAIYSGFYVVISLAYNVLWYAATHGKHLLAPEVSEEQIARTRHSYQFGFAAYLIATLGSLINGYLGLGICAALWLYWSVQVYEAGTERHS
jgi:uncharacterized membrane protein